MHWMSRAISKQAQLALLAVLVGLGVQGPVLTNVQDIRTTTICSAINRGDQVAGRASGATRRTCYGPGEASSAAHADAMIAVREASPRLGHACRNVYFHLVTFVVDASGSVSATFDFAGGRASGQLPLATSDVIMIDRHAAYVSDAQIGSYEPVDAEQGSWPLVCKLSSTFHFYCPVTDTLDQLCYTWVDRQYLRHLGS